MEVVVGLVGSEERTIEDIAADKPGCDSSSLERVTDPVVYKLVRVDFDGRLVPATDDELMEVENLLEFEKSEMLYGSDVVKTVEHGLDNDDTSEKPLLEIDKGSSQDKNAEVDEENLKAHPEETLPSSSLSLNDKEVNQLGNTLEDSSLQDGSNKSGSSGSKPNFSWLKGEINLDKLTIRELKETFRATFGRETSVKDKLWLKRRITMGLTNSCDISMTSFIMQDGKFLTKKEVSKKMDCENSVTGEVCSAEDMPGGCQNLVEDNVDGVHLRNSLSDSGCRSDDTLEQRAAKRVRKPTKRYIEELSDKETKDCSGKLSKQFEQDKEFSSLPIRPAGGLHSGVLVTRPDSIGGSGVQVPFVSRIRRCRPRKSIMTLTKFQSSDVAMPGEIVERSVTTSNPQPGGLTDDKVLEVKSVPFEDPLTSEEEREKRCLTSISNPSQDNREPKDIDSAGHTSRNSSTGGANSEANLQSVPTTKDGALRRKHHRAWTLTEVVKLVDGVSRFGAGRWSEIKRLSFSSYSYRTSVDLKDKWRNLLKASFANSPADKGMNPRKNALSPIPAPILVKVRELAEINGQAHRVFKASSENSESSVNENRSSGYL